MKGHILILSANILFGVSMPVFKYLLTSDVPPEAITIMRAIFACMMFWFVSLFMPKEKVLPKDLRTLFICALCGVGINQWLFVVGLKSSSPVDASIIATAVPIFVLLLAAVVLKEPVTAKKSFGVFLGVRSVARVQLRTYFRRNCQPLGRYTDAAESVDVFRLSGLVQTFVPILFVRDNDEMDVSVLHIDTRSVLSPARAARPHIPSGNFRHNANVRTPLSAVWSHVRRIHAYPDGIETHPSHYGQHVQLCAAHCCLRNSHCCRAGHSLDTKTVVGGFGICRCLLGDEE